MFKREKTFSRRFLGIFLSLAIVMSACVFSAAINAAAEQDGNIYAGDSHIVYADNFDGDRLDTAKWAWAGADQGKDQYAAEIADGKLNLLNCDTGSSGVAGLRYVKGDKHIDQRVSIEFEANGGSKPHVWARVGQPVQNAYARVNGYYVLFNYNSGSTPLLVIHKRVNYRDTIIMQSAYFNVVDGAKYRLELVVQGTSPTLVNAYMYRVMDSGDDQIVGLASVTDNDPILQTAGSAGISALASNSGTTVAVDNFEYTSTDDVAGRYYVEEASPVNNVTFGQVVALDPNKKYIFTAQTIDKGIYGAGEAVNPLWIEYFNTKNSMERALIDRLKLSSNRDRETAESNGIEYNEYFTVFYTEFDLSAISNKKVETSSTYSYTRVLVGFRCDRSVSTSNAFSHFALYAADDPNKTNLLVNPDFKMGLYAWNDSANSCMNHSPCKESVVTPKVGNVTFSDPLTEYEYYEMFKNTGYEVVRGDANRDKLVDVRDLINMKKQQTQKVKGYNVAVDYDTDGYIHATDPPKTAQFLKNGDLKIKRITFGYFIKICLMWV